MTGGDARRTSWTETWIAPALVAAVAALVFARSIGGAFVYDDARFVAENPAVTGGVAWTRYFAEPATVDQFGTHGIVRPLRTLEFALDWRAFGGGTAGFHVHALLWHVLAAVLLLAVLRRLLGDARAALVGALFWAVHPAQVESVAWISSRGDVAMGACALLSVLFALRADGWGRDLVLSLVAAGVAMLFKETAVVLPLVVLALRWTGRARPTPGGSRTARGHGSRAPAWPYAALAAAYLVYRFALGGTDQSAGYVLGGSAAGTFATMFRGFGWYLAETLLPSPALDWYLTPSTALFDVAALFWLAVHAALLASAFRARRRAPTWTLAVAWFYAFLLPVSNWPFYLGIPTTERFLYLPLAGAALALGAAIVRVPRAAGAAVVAVVALGAGSAARVPTWRSDDVLWRTTLADHESPLAHNALSRSTLVEAIELRERARATPDGPDRDAAVARAIALLEESLDHSHRSIALWNRFELRTLSASARTRVSEAQAAGVCGVLGRDAEALFHADNAIRIGPDDDPKPHFDRANALLALGFAPQAVASMRSAWKIAGATPDAGVAEFFLRAAKACEERRLHMTARFAYQSAAAAAPTGQMQREADAQAELLGLAEIDEAPERAALERLDEAFALLPRTCPFVEKR